jgi:hypothetical protein
MNRIKRIPTRIFNVVPTRIFSIIPMRILSIFPARIFTIMGLLMIYPAVYSQASLDSLLERVIQNNPTITGAGQYYENVRLASRTNLFPENPDLESAY